MRSRSSKRSTRTDPESCLPIPGWTHHVRGRVAIHYEAEDLDGVRRFHDAHGFEARVICHEVDHLDGRLIIDHGPRQDQRGAARWLAKRMR